MFGFPNAKEAKQNKVSFYVYVNGKQAGPISEAEMRKLVNNGTITMETLVWKQGLEQWSQAQFVPSVNKFFLLKNDFQKEKKKENTSVTHRSIQSDMIVALTNLGFKSNTVKPLVDEILSAKPMITLEEGIKEALKILQ
ncbi:MAG: DUF4339 domain-containing protein [Bacteroidales bacterium]|nr:DUF4339 domain-containing protein [Bacteroidales bacterium]